MLKPSFAYPFPSMNKTKTTALVITAQARTRCCTIIRPQCPISIPWNPGEQGMLKARHPIPVGTSYLSKCRDESLGAGFASHCNNEISLLWKRGQLRDLKHTSVQSHWRLAELA